MQIVAFRVVRLTRNFENMVHFYQDTLEMKRITGWDRPNNRGALLSPGENLGETVIEILDLNNLAVPNAKPENVELGLEVDNVSAWHQRLLGKGISIARELEDMPWGHRSFGIDDPDGFRIWLYQVIG